MESMPFKGNNIITVIIVIIAILVSMIREIRAKLLSHILREQDQSFQPEQEATRTLRNGKMALAVLQYPMTVKVERAINTGTPFNPRPPRE